MGTNLEKGRSKLTRFLLFVSFLSVVVYSSSHILFPNQTTQILLYYCLVVSLPLSYLCAVQFTDRESPTTVFSAVESSMDDLAVGDQTVVQGRAAVVATRMGDTIKITYPSWDPTRRDILVPCLLFAYSVLVFLKYRGRTLAIQLGFDSIAPLFLQIREIHIVSVLGYLLFAYFAFRIIKWYTDTESPGYRDLYTSLHQKFVSIETEVTALHIGLIFAVVIAIVVRMWSLSFDSYFPDTFVQPILASDLLTGRLFKYAESVPVPVNFDWALPSNQWYPRGWPFTLLLASSIAVLGQTDLAVRIPVILLGTLHLPVVYYLGSLLLNKKAGLVTASLIAVSGWSIAISTYIRHYVLYDIAFLISVASVIRFFRDPSRKRLLEVGIVISFLLHTHLQALIPVAVLVPLVSLRLYLEREHRQIVFNTVFVFLLSSLTLLVIFQPFDYSISVFVTPVAYHLPISVWAAVWVCIVLTAITLHSTPAGQCLNITFFGTIFLITLLINMTGRTLLPRYMTVVYPLLILYVSAGVVLIGKRISDFLTLSVGSESIHALGTILITVVLVTALVPGFQAPEQEYSKESVWPQNYDPQTQAMGSIQSDITMKFPQGYSEQIQGQVSATRGDVAILSNGANDALWYVQYNEQTATTADPYWLANYTYLPKYSFNSSSDYFSPNQWEKTPSQLRYHQISGIPVTATPSDIEAVMKNYSDGFVIISKDYSHRVSPSLKRYLMENMAVEKETQEVVVYRWG